MVNTEIKLIAFFVAEDGQAVYSQQEKKKTKPAADLFLLFFGTLHSDV